MAAFDGSGNYVRSYKWVTDKANGIDITASRQDTELDGIAAALSICVTRDGQGKMGSDFVPNTDNAWRLGNFSFRWASIDAVAFRATSNQVLGLGPVAGALVDMTPDSGSFTGTFTGFTAGVTGTCKWARIGALVYLLFPAGAGGTSNVNTFTMTGLPSAIQPTTGQRVSMNGAAVTNGGIAVGATGNSPFNCSADIAGGTITFWMGGSAAGWSNANNKGFNQNTVICYLLV